MEHKSDEIMVSVFCLAYNHEKFIRKTLDGFVGQNTTFKYEVLINDDASTDSTADIIREYEEKYPDIIKPVYQKENQYCKKIGLIKTFLFPKAKGKYLAWCEGDDYWVDPNKLQEQVDALESNSNCSACYSKVEKISINGDRLGVFFPVRNFDAGVIDSEQYLRYCLDPARFNGFPLQLAGFMIRRDIYSAYINDPPQYRSSFEVGDIPLFLYAGT